MKSKHGNNTVAAIISTFILSIAFMGGSLVNAKTSLSDLKGHWAEKTLSAWVDKGFIKGYGDGSFRPAKPITRAEFVVVVNRAFGFTQSAAAAFTDVSENDWYYGELSIAKAAGYINGTPNGKFMPERTISRQEVAVIMARLLALQPSDPAEQYRDLRDAPAWSKGAIGAMISSGLMRGFPDGTFRPEAVTSRAEAVVILDRSLPLKNDEAANNEDNEQTSGGGEGGSGNGGGGTGGGSSGPTEQPFPDMDLINGLLNDPLLAGTRGTTPNSIYETLDEAYTRLKNISKPLGVGESFLNTFDGGYYQNPIRGFRSMGGQVQFFASSDPAYSVNGTNALVIDSISGSYRGIYLDGQRFAPEGTYKVEFDYKIVAASDDFFFQFKAGSAGRDGPGAGDRFVAITGTSGQTGHIEQVFNLERYYDYEMMIFPRNQPGIIAIDNLKVTRLDTRPTAEDVTIAGNLEVGSCLTASYQYEDAENDPEGPSRFRWFTALDAGGLNKTLIATGTKQITLQQVNSGKWIGLEVVPVSIVNGEEIAGTPVATWSEAAVGGTAINLGAVVELDEGEHFVENFESDDASPKLYMYSQQSNSYISGAAGESIVGKTLVLNTEGSYKGVNFSNIKFTGGKTYQISFDYKVVESPDKLYVQLRSDSGGYSHDKFTLVDLNGGMNGVGAFSYQFTLDELADYRLMVFVEHQGGIVLLDNLRIENVFKAGFH